MTHNLSPMEKVMLGYGAIEDPYTDEKEITEAVTHQQRPETKTFGQMLTNNPYSNVNAFVSISNGYAKSVGENDPGLHKDARKIQRLQAEQEAIAGRIAAIHDKYAQ
ncbi:MULTISPECIES: hypothetical protein [Bacillus cereus group]|uniref:hypothetical protein n=1 Tax=Bacillus cereus group TaxID=86661 RepID=UPI000BEB8D5C|nr:MULTISPECIES: hypothetical protein [Bacillus cereus group]MBE7129599.1 hypothetical protein [Bacillus mycoides]PEC59206.1 hypothetical protein CON91_22930 [Bacillus wiedmannii]